MDNNVAVEWPQPACRTTCPLDAPGGCPGAAGSPDMLLCVSLVVVTQGCWLGGMR